MSVSPIVESFLSVLPAIFIAVIILIVIGMFIFFLIRFLKCPKENAEERRQRGRVAFAFGMVIVIIAAAFGGLFLLLMSAISNM